MPISSRPWAYRLDQFPDIPLPAGFIPDPQQPQLAVAFAGGALRRCEIALLSRDGVRQQEPEMLLLRLDADLQRLGWVPAGQGAWTKANERLLIETGRDGDRTSIRVRLRPLNTPLTAVATDRAG
jgi:hypothetical protein